MLSSIATHGIVSNLEDNLKRKPVSYPRNHHVFLGRCWSCHERVSCPCTDEFKLFLFKARIVCFLNGFPFQATQIWMRSPNWCLLVFASALFFISQNAGCEFDFAKEHMEQSCIELLRWDDALLRGKFFVPSFDLERRISLVSILVWIKKKILSSWSTRTSARHMSVRF